MGRKKKAVQAAAIQISRCLPGAGWWAFVFPCGVFSAAANTLWRQLPGLTGMRPPRCGPDVRNWVRAWHLAVRPAVDTHARIAPLYAQMLLHPVVVRVLRPHARSRVEWRAVLHALPHQVGGAPAAASLNATQLPPPPLLLLRSMRAPRFARCPPRAGCRMPARRVQHAKAPPARKHRCSSGGGRRGRGRRRLEP